MAFFHWRSVAVDLGIALSSATVTELARVSFVQKIGITFVFVFAGRAIHWLSD